MSRGEDRDSYGILRSGVGFGGLNSIATGKNPSNFCCPRVLRLDGQNAFVVTTRIVYIGQLNSVEVCQCKMDGGVAGLHAGDLLELFGSVQGVAGTLKGHRVVESGTHGFRGQLQGLFTGLKSEIQVLLSESDDNQVVLGLKMGGVQLCRSSVRTQSGGGIASFLGA